MADPVPPTSDQAGPVVVTLPAEIDMANARAVRDKLYAACAPGSLIIADMTATTFCDSMGIGALVLAHKGAAAHGACLRLLLPCPRVMQVMKILGLDVVLPIYRSLEEASAGSVVEDTESWGPA